MSCFGPFKLVAGGISLLLVLAGCDGGPTAKFERETSQRVQSGAFTYRIANKGRLVGTVGANATILGWARVASLEGATAQAFDPDGTPVTDKVKVDGAGHFVMDTVRDSRPRLFVEVDVNSLRYRATVDAPRDRRDYPLNLDPGSTYVADKLRRAALDQDVALDRLDGLRILETEQTVNAYLDDNERRRVLEQSSSDLNAYAFDHFMDDHAVVKSAVYVLSPAILRGWEPTNVVSLAAPPAPVVVQPPPAPKPTTTEEEAPPEGTTAK